MKKNLYLQPVTKILSLASYADVCEPQQGSATPAPVIYGPEPMF